MLFQPTVGVRDGVGDPQAPPPLDLWTVYEALLSPVIGQVTLVPCPHPGPLPASAWVGTGGQPLGLLPKGWVPQNPWLLGVSCGEPCWHFS